MNLHFLKLQIYFFKFYELINNSVKILSIKLIINKGCKSDGTIEERKKTVFGPMLKTKVKKSLFFFVIILFISVYTAFSAMVLSLDNCSRLKKYANLPVLLT